MTDPRIPAGPLEREPGGPFIPHQERWELLDQALAGVKFGAWDLRILDWLASHLDTSTMLTVASLIQRARAAELAAKRDRFVWGPGDVELDPPTP